LDSIDALLPDYLPHYDAPPHSWNLRTALVDKFVAAMMAGRQAAADSAIIPA